MTRLTPGATVLIGNGTYAETISPLISGTPLARITITGWPGRQPVVGTGVAYGALVSGRSYVTVSNLLFSGSVGEGVYLIDGDHNTVDGTEVRSAGAPVSGKTAAGIRLTNTANATVTDNYTHGNSDSGIYVSGSTTGALVARNESSLNARQFQRNANGINVIAAGNTIQGNITHDNEDSGIQFYPGGNNNLAVNNVTYNNGDHGIDDLNVTGGRLTGNTVFRNCTSGINVEGTSGNYVVKNNVAVDNAVYPAYKGISCSRRAGNIGIWDSAPPSTTVDHNLVWLTKTGTMYVFGSSFTSLSTMRSATGQEAHGVQADPRFMGAATWDLRLQSGSAAIDRADSSAPGQQAVDVLGSPRVDDPDTPNTFAEGPRLYDDVGAFEFQGQSPPPPPIQPPTAKLTVTPTSGAAPLSITANASASTDPQGQTLTYAFDFGDGTVTGSQASSSASHTYTTAGSYTAAVTATNTSGLASTASQTVTVTAPTAQPPTAKLTVTPSTGALPLAVMADASGSADPQGQPLTYAFDFGDGTATGAQASSSTSHTYTTAGTFSVKVTVTNTAGLASTASQTVTAAAPSSSPPAFVGTIANNYSTSFHTSGYVTVYKAAGVQAGDLVVLSLQLSGTAATGDVSATDPAGNTYTPVASVADSAGNRLVVLAGVAVRTLAPNDKITATFPSAATYRLSGDEYVGATHADQTAAAAGTSTAFTSGVAQATVGNEIAIGVVATYSGTTNPTWSAGWTPVATYSVSGRYLSKAYQLPASGGYAATGNATGSWLAAVVTLAS